MTIHKLRVRTLAFCLALALLGCSAELPGEVKVMMSGWFAPAYRELGPHFEDATGDTLVTILGPTEGAALNAIAMRLARGERADVLIVVSDALDDQIHAGTVVPEACVRWIDLRSRRIGLAATREG